MPDVLLKYQLKNSYQISVKLVIGGEEVHIEVDYEWVHPLAKSAKVLGMLKFNDLQRKHGCPRLLHLHQEE